jgi:hypothetical protein
MSGAFVTPQPEWTMKYICLIYADEHQLSRLEADEEEAVGRECVEYSESLRRTGQFLAAERLAPVGAAVTVRVRDGRPVITDGPFAETKEQLGGFYLIEARDLNEAIRVASKIPPARLGTVEVRPLCE